MEKINWNDWVLKQLCFEKSGRNWTWRSPKQLNVSWIRMDKTATSFCLSMNYGICSHKRMRLPVNWAIFKDHTSNFCHGCLHCFHGCWLIYSFIQSSITHGKHFWDKCDGTINDRAMCSFLQPKIASFQFRKHVFVSGKPKICACAHTQTYTDIHNSPSRWAPS